MKVFGALSEIVRVIFRSGGRETKLDAATQTGSQTDVTFRLPNLANNSGTAVVAELVEKDLQQTLTNKVLSSNTRLANAAVRAEGISTGTPVLQFYQDAFVGTNKISMSAPAGLGSDYSFTLPNSAGPGQAAVLASTAGNGTTTWVRYDSANTTGAIVQRDSSTNGFTSGAITVSANSSSDALKVTQTGSGNALLIEDAASDTTPFVIKADGRVGIGTSSPASELDVVGTTLLDTAQIDSQLLMGGPNGFIRDYASGYSTNHTASQLYELGRLNFTGNSQNVTIVGELRASVGGASGVSRFVLELRSNTLPSKTIAFQEEISQLGALINVKVYQDAASGLVVLGYLSSSVIQNIGWSIKVQERGNYNYFQQVTTLTPLSIATLTEVPLTQTAVQVNAANQVIAVNSSTDALRITQEGSGNALVVEDSANPDSTPFVISANGRVGIGTTAPATFLDVNGIITGRNEFNTTVSTENSAVYHWSNSKSRGTPTAPAIVASGDDLLQIKANAYDGSAYLTAARILAQVDGTPNLNNMPGRLVFSTTAGGSTTPVERLRIDSNGNISASGTGALKLPSGTTSDRSGLTTPGMIRYNTDSGSFEGYASGAWSPVGGSSGQGELNLVTNPSAATDHTTGWTYVGLSATRDTSGSPLNPVVATGFSLNASASSQTATTAALSVPSSLRNTKLKVEFYYEYVSGASFTVDVLDGASAQYALTTDVNGVTTLAQRTGKFVAYFDSNNTNTLAVRLTSTGAGVMKFTQVVVGPGIQPQGAVVSGATSFTPSFASSALGTLATSTAYWWREGDSIRIQGTVTAGTVTGSNLLLTLPFGTVDTTHATGQIVGRWARNSATANARKMGDLFISSAGVTNGIYFGSDDYASATNPFTALPASGLIANGDVVSFEAKVKIAEWAGSGTVQLAQNDVEYAYNTTAWGTDNTSSNFGYGPGGASITGALTGSLTQRITFQTPIQAGDDLAVEISSDGKIWRRSDVFMDASGNPVINSYSSAATGISSAGVYLKSISNNTTQIDVLFMRYAAMANDDSPVVDWQNGWKWRVRKSSAGAAVGFGIVSSSSAGLLPASNSNLDDATATRLGLKQYLADKAGGTNDIAYNNGNKATLTADDNASIAISTVKGAVLIPYQMQNGAWRLKVNINMTVASATRTNCSVYINGVTTKNGPHQAASACQISTSSVGVIFGLVYPNTAGRIQAVHASATTSEYVYSADFELESKPTWAY